MSHWNYQPEHLKKGKDFFGEPTWTFFHCATAAYRPDKEEHFICFLDAFPHLLPCDDCKDHLIALLKKVPVGPYLRSNHDLFFWGYHIHDEVNQQCNKRRKKGEALKISPPYDEVKDKFFRALQGECEACRAI